MELYHGTSIKHLDSILQSGLLPRKYTGISNYTGCISNPNYVYLTNCFALNRAYRAIKDKEDAVIFRVNVNTTMLYPDDDYIRYKYSIKYSEIDIAEWQEEWSLSLYDYGLTAHYGSLEYVDYDIIPYKDLVNTVDTYYSPSQMSSCIRTKCEENLKNRFNGL